MIQTLPARFPGGTRHYVVLSYLIGQMCILSWLYPAPQNTHGVFLQMIGLTVLFFVTIGTIYEWFRALPRLKIKQAVLLMFSIIILVVEIFAVAFYVIFCCDHASFTAQNADDLLVGIFQHGYEFLYYSVTTFTGTGYGDVIPVSAVAKEVASCEMLAGWMISTVMMALLGSKISQFFLHRDNG